MMSSFSRTSNTNLLQTVAGVAKQSCGLHNCTQPIPREAIIPPEQPHGSTGFPAWKTPKASSSRRTTESCSHRGPPRTAQHRGQQVRPGTRRARAALRGIRAPPPQSPKTDPSPPSPSPSLAPRWVLPTLNSPKASHEPRERRSHAADHPDLTAVLPSLTPSLSRH